MTDFRFWRRSEEELFEAVIRYTKQFKAKDVREQALTTILPYIRKAKQPSA